VTGAVVVAGVLVGVDGAAVVVVAAGVWLVPVPGAPLLAPQPAVSTTGHAVTASPAAEREIIMAVSLRSRPMSTVPLFFRLAQHD
jgi:hypothetical protein